MHLERKRAFPDQFALFARSGVLVAIVAMTWPSCAALLRGYPELLRTTDYILDVMLTCLALCGAARWIFLQATTDFDLTEFASRLEIALTIFCGALAACVLAYGALLRDEALRPSYHASFGWLACLAACYLFSLLWNVVLELRDRFI